MARFSPKALLRFVPFVLLALAAFVLWRELHTLNLGGVRAAMAQWGWNRSIAALLFSFLVYVMLAANEQVALRWARARVPLKIGMRNAFIAFALANTLGFGFLVGGAFRANAYRRWDVGIGKVTQITAYGTLTFTLGVLALAGGLLLRAPDPVFRQLAVQPVLGRAVGGAMWAGLALYAAAGALAPERVRIFGFEFKPPRPGLVLIQVSFGVGDLMAGAAVFWLLLGRGAPHYTDFLSAYIISIMAGLLSGVPGGAGVFETAMLQLLPMVDRTSLAAAFLGFRVFYYLAPLAVGLLLLFFVRHRRPKSTEAQEQQAEA